MKGFLFIHVEYSVFKEEVFTFRRFLDMEHAHIQLNASDLQKLT